MAIGGGVGGKAVARGWRTTRVSPRPKLALVPEPPGSFAQCLAGIGFQERDRWLATTDDLFAVLTEGQGRIQTVNLSHLRLLFQDQSFQRVMREADYLCADGWPVVLLARRAGLTCERVTGSGFLFDLVEDLHPKAGRRVALIGASDWAGDRLAERLAETGRELVYREHGRWKDWDPVEVTEELRDAGADLVLVSVTPPAGEVFAALLRQCCPEIPIIGVGGAVDMVAGRVKQAPPRWRRLGLEWVWRMVHDPARLARRYLAGDLPFFFRHVVPVLVRPERAVDAG